MKHAHFHRWGRAGVASSVLVATITLVVMPNVGLPYEREIVLSEEYQTEREKVVLKDRFRLDLGFGYGLSYAQILTGLYGLDPHIEAYLESLGLEYSETYGVFRVAGIYALSPRTGVYLGVPFSAVELKHEKGVARLFEESDVEFGVGDVYGGAYYHLLLEGKRTPSVIASLDMNSDMAKYSSLGDGTWDFTGGIYARKYVSDSFYVFGMADYTARLEKHDTDPGDVFGYGGGIGFLLGGSFLEVGLRAASIGETKIGEATWFDSDEDLALTFALKSPPFVRGGDARIIIANLDEGFDIKRNTFGFEYSFPIF